MEAEERPSKIRKLGDVRQTQLNNDDHEELQSPEKSFEDQVTSVMAARNPSDEVSSTKDGSMSDGRPISKNAMKRLLREQQWNARQDERKQKRKEKQVEKRARKRLERTETAALVASSENQADGESTRASQRVGVPLTFLIDCDFDEQMTEKEIVSIAAQITRCYSENRKAMYRPILSLSSFHGRIKARFETALRNAHTQWGNVRVEEADFAEVAQEAKSWMLEMSGPGLSDCSALAAHKSDASEDGEIVYLTADSDETLDELRPHSTYIIGGIVDRNRHKGICYKRAKDRGIKTARLPIGEFMKMESRAVLTTNHVYEIMLRWLELKDWGEAFMRVIPKRKGGMLKNAGEIRDSNDAGLQGNDKEDDNKLPA